MYSAFACPAPSGNGALFPVYGTWAADLKYLYGLKNLANGICMNYKMSETADGAA